MKASNGNTSEVHSNANENSNTQVGIHAHDALGPPFGESLRAAGGSKIAHYAQITFIVFTLLAPGIATTLFIHADLKEAILENKAEIKKNRELIQKNMEGIADLKVAIAENKSSIRENRSMIEALGEKLTGLVERVRKVEIRQAKLEVLGSLESADPPVQH